MSNILITAGPTRERLDPVRFLSNFSTGKMGYALARQAVAKGHRVTLISGPVSLEPPKGATTVNVESAAEMLEATLREAKNVDVIIMAAAVADYRPAEISTEKMKKSSGDLVLRLERTKDILAELGKTKREGQLYVGFAAETSDLLEKAKDKMARKNLDWIAANDVGKKDRGFAVDQNAVTLISKDGEVVDIDLAPKDAVAEKILDIVLGDA